MVFGAIMGGAKKVFGGGKKKKAAPQRKELGPSPGEKLKPAAARATKELLTPVRSARKPMRMRAGARKAISRGSSRSGGR